MSAPRAAARRAPGGNRFVCGFSANTSVASSWRADVRALQPFPVYEFSIFLKLAKKMHLPKK